MAENTVIGYSERGVMNAIAYTIGKDVKQFTEFINLSKLNFNADDIKKIDLYVEHSLSQFGDADMIAIVHFNNSKESKVIFFEAKVKTFKPKSWSLEKVYRDFKNKSLEGKKEYDGYFSNLYYQLYAKKLFFKNIKKEAEHAEGGKDPLSEGIEDPLCIVNGKKRERKIGENGIVTNLRKILEDCDNQAYYVAVVPNISKKVPNPIKHEDLPFDDLSLDINYITWEQIKDQYEELKEVFKYNNGQIY